MSMNIDKKKLINIIVWAVIGVLLILILIPLASLAVQKLQKKPVPKFLGYSYMVVLTPSMTGYANVGDVVVIRETDDLEVHDVVTYIDSRGDVVTHRITSINNETGIIKVKGDTNLHDDPIDLTIDDIEGKVVLVIPKIGLIFTWLIEEGGWVYLFAIVAVIGVGIYLLNKLKAAPQAETATEGEANTTDGEPKSEQPATEQTTAVDDSEQKPEENSKDDNNN